MCDPAGKTVIMESDEGKAAVFYASLDPGILSRFVTWQVTNQWTRDLSGHRRTPPWHHIIKGDFRGKMVIDFASLCWDILSDFMTSQIIKNGSYDLRDHK